MNCPRCGAPTKVLETRVTKVGEQTLRRRECLNTTCRYRCSTVEVLVAAGRGTTIPRLGAVVAPVRLPPGRGKAAKHYQITIEKEKDHDD